MTHLPAGSIMFCLAVYFSIDIMKENHNVCFIGGRQMFVVQFPDLDRPGVGCLTRCLVVPFQSVASGTGEQNLPTVICRQGGHLHGLVLDDREDVRTLEMLTRGRRVVPRAGVETRDRGHADQGQARHSAAKLDFRANLGEEDLVYLRIICLILLLYHWCLQLLLETI